MERLNRVVLNLIFCIQVFLLFLLFVETRIQLPPWLQVAGRLHPLVLHVPIGGIVFLSVLILFRKQIGEVVTDQVLRIGLLLVSLSASMAALFGFFLSLQSDYGIQALQRHKVGGVILSCLCYAALVWHTSQRKKSVLVGIGILSCVTLIFTGHTGAVLTHGENFLLAPISRPEIILTADNASFYYFAVEPVLQRKCFSCHNEAKAKGGLVMTTVEKFIAGGKNGAAWAAGDPADSRMIKAFYLPLNDDKHMPPDGKPQLSPMEVALLKAWIQAGPDFEKKIDQFDDADTLKQIVASLRSVQPSPEPQLIYPFQAVDEEVVRSLNTPFRTVFPLYQGSPALQVDFFVRKAFEEQALEDLKAIKDQLVILNLSRMPVTDKNLSVIKLFENLEHVNLNFSAIHGEGLSELKALKNLTSISLAGTMVEAPHLEPILLLPRLKNVYVWNTKVTDKQRDSLAGIYPEVSIITSQFYDKAVLKLSRPMLENDGIVSPGEDVVLKHPMPGVTIRYTLDGSEPDTVAGLVYEKPFRLTETTVIKARACKDSWYCSPVMKTTCFVAGIKPTGVELLTPPDPQYPAEGVSSLTDGRKGLADVLKEPSWLGYRNQPFEVGIRFEGPPPTVKKVVLSYGNNLGAYSFPPQEVEVWGGKDKNALTLLKTMRIEQPSNYEPLRVEALAVPIKPSVYPYYKVIARPVEKLPVWHRGKGEKGWIFVDELFLY